MTGVTRDALRALAGQWDAAIVKAKEELFGLADGSRRWTMSIPVRDETDSDHVLYDGLVAGRAAVASLPQLLDQIERLEGALERSTAWLEIVTERTLKIGEAVAIMEQIDANRAATAAPGEP